jgi:hypothetical protein
MILPRCPICQLAIWVRAAGGHAVSRSSERGSGATCTCRVEQSLWCEVSWWPLLEKREKGRTANMVIPPGHVKGTGGRSRFNKVSADSGRLLAAIQGARKLFYRAAEDVRSLRHGALNLNSTMCRSAGAKTKIPVGRKGPNMSIGSRMGSTAAARNHVEEEPLNATPMDLKAWAAAGFERFQQVWKFDDFWKRSNTFHAFLRFVDAAERKWGPNDPEVKKMSSLRDTMITTNSGFFDGQIGGGGVWADDYGWCGISCLAARDYLRRIGDQNRAADYLNRAAKCWLTMRDLGYDFSNDAEPVRHGCSNISQDDKKKGIKSAKNTVTNANLLVLSLRLYDAFKNTDKVAAAPYLEMTYVQYLWFNAWFQNNYVSLDDGYYLRGFPGPYGLIHERPMAKPSYTVDSRPPWERGWTWTGDQGLMLAALAEIYLIRDDLRARFSIDPVKFANDVNNAFVTIATGVRVLLFRSPDKVLREAPFHSSFDYHNGADYVGGRGVLLRYLSEQSVQKMAGGPFFPQGIGATAQAVWNSSDSQHQFAALWNKENDLAFNQEFVKVWGSGDSSIGDWALDSSETVHGVLQAAGLDALAAAILLDAG